MAGTNEPNSPISVKAPSQLEKTGDQLRAYADQTENMTYVNPFQNFPYETGRGDNLRRWHPVKHYCADSDAC